MVRLLPALELVERPPLVMPLVKKTLLVRQLIMPIKRPPVNEDAVARLEPKAWAQASPEDDTPQERWPSDNLLP